MLANLVLAEADAAVLRVAGERAFYARYCDDVVFASAGEAECRRMMSAYEDALARLELPMHPVAPFVYHPADGTRTRYTPLRARGRSVGGRRGSYYVRMNTENGAIERLVAGHAPEGFSHFAEVIRFAALHKECRYQTGERTARDCGRVGDFD